MEGAPKEEHRKGARPRHGLQGLLEQKHLTQIHTRVAAEAEDTKIRIAQEQVRSGRSQAPNATSFLHRADKLFTLC
jgi:hypothetical protein